MLLAIFIPIANMSGIVENFKKFWYNYCCFGNNFLYCSNYSYSMIRFTFVNPKHSKFYLMTESIFLSMDRIYKNLLTKAIKFKFVTLISGFSIFAISIILSSNLGMVFMPKEEKSQFEVIIKQMQIFQWKRWKNYNKYSKELLSISEVDYSSLTIGLNGNIYESSIYVRLVPIDKEQKLNVKLWKRLDINRKHLKI